MKRRLTPRRPRCDRRSRLWNRYESLEARNLLAANLHITNVQFLDGQLSPIDRPIVGEEIRLRAEWTSTDVLSSYRLRFLHDNIPLTPAPITTISELPGQAVTSATIIGGWFATPGQHRIEVRLDSADQIVEDNETDNRFVINYSPNAPVSLPDKLLQPLAGKQNEDWFVTNYVDVDPRTQTRDYTGGTFTKSGSRGIDLVLPNAGSIDSGIPIYATLAGTVTNVAGEARTGIAYYGFEADERSGALVHNLGDFNADGFDDLGIVAPETDRVYVVFGHSAPLSSSFELGSLLPENGGDGSQGFVIEGVRVEAMDRGDFNADGIADLLLGVPSADIGDEIAVGRAYVVFGSIEPRPATFDISQLLVANGGDGRQGMVFSGKNEFDGAGTSVSNLGDINGDQVDDLAIGAPFAEIGNPLLFTERFDVGKVYVVFGKATPFAAEVELKDFEFDHGGDGSEAIVFHGVNDFDQLGQAVGGIGDVNDDGINDIGLSAAFNAGQGEGYVVFGKATVWDADFDLFQLYPPPPPPPPQNPPPPPPNPPPIPPVNQGDGSEGFVIPGLNLFDLTATPIGAAGDLNHDGIDDWYVSATGADGDGFNQGLVYVLYGQSTPYEAILDLSRVSPARGGTGVLGTAFEGVADFDQAGGSVTELADINGDGITDLMIGAPSAGPNSEGEAYVVFGRNGGLGASFRLDSLANGDGTKGFTLRGESLGAAAGISVSSAGDLNQDGLEDLLVGAQNSDRDNVQAGTTYVVFGRTSNSGPVVDLASIFIPTNQIEIDHGNGWHTRYSRLLPDSATVRTGEFVLAGDVLGLVGPNTTRANPTFLFEIN